MPDIRTGPRPLFTHIGLILERVRQQAGIEPAALAVGMGVDDAYMASVLKGISFPPRRFILRYARSCGADARILVKIWEDERERRLPSADNPHGGEPVSSAGTARAKQ
ncbi:MULTISPECIES: helix-turn-helix transcriptional regulator [unclassified Streptomyces]|uniref:helix-turn-helix domain-containing protein n=1 Tax=unclassified Streptomyces TaxID=2593676 RepID=UPI00332A30F4